MKPPWVLVTGDFVMHGGQDRANYELARFLAEGGDREVHLLGFRAAPELLAMPGVQFQRVPRPLGSYFLADPLLSRAADQLIRKHAGRAHVVVNGGNCSRPAINWVHAVHELWTVRDAGAPALHRLKNRLNKVRSRRAERRAFRAAPLLLANSEATQRALVQSFGLAPERIAVVYLGVDPSVYTPATAEARARARNALGVVGDEVVALFIGALPFDRNKGLDTILQAWSHLPPEAGRVWAVGGGRLEYWRGMIRDQGLAERVTLLGPSVQVSELLGAADVLLAPSRYESYGLAVHEALCRGVPAITSASSGIAERFSAGLRPLLLQRPGDAAELRRRLRHWREERPRFRELALQLGAELRRHSWRDMARQIVERVEAVRPGEER